ncbi:metal-dependent hydrolase [uncultured Psychroserpens sp.]|uniref:metal-dependent hydrolase n=1 Tax=uncultured Psychroserpens sp. TaxID=255436 RepID=UPI00260DEB6D|nr:metal-dependent hydrolase [uncultured Psychroserpens sp.]
MASIFGHGILAFTLSKALNHSNLKGLTILAILSSILPDIDVLAFCFNIPYEHMFGHRGFTHSIVFAVLWSSLLTFIFSKTYRLSFFIVLFLSTLSHGILDAMTTGGEGIGFLIPFNDDRYFFPFRVIKVSPIGIENFFSEWGIQVILSEIKFILLPCTLLLMVIFITKRITKNSNKSTHI